MKSQGLEAVAFAPSVSGPTVVPSSGESKTLVVAAKETLAQKKVEKTRISNDKILLIVLLSVIVVGAIGFFIWWFLIRKPANTQPITINSFLFAAPSGAAAYTQGTTTTVPTLNVFSQNALTSPPSIPVTFVYAFSSNTNPTTVSKVYATDSTGKQYNLSVTSNASDGTVVLSSAAANTSESFTITAVGTDSNVTSNALPPITVVYVGKLPTVSLTAPPSLSSRGVYRAKPTATYIGRLGATVPGGSIQMSFTGGAQAISGTYTVNDAVATTVNLSSNNLANGNFILDTTAFTNSQVSVQVTLNYYTVNGTPLSTVTSNSVNVAKGGSSSTPITGIASAPLLLASSATTAGASTLSVTPSSTFYLMFAVTPADGTFVGGTITSSDTTTTPVPASNTVANPNNPLTYNSTTNMYVMQMTASSSAASYTYIVSLTPTAGASAILSTQAQTPTLTVSSPNQPVTGFSSNLLLSTTAGGSQSQSQSFASGSASALFLAFTPTPSSGSFVSGTVTTIDSSSNQVQTAIPASKSANTVGSALTYIAASNQYVMQLAAPTAASTYTYSVSLVPTAGAAAVQTSASQAATASVTQSVMTQITGTLGLSTSAAGAAGAQSLTVLPSSSIYLTFATDGAFSSGTVTNSAAGSTPATFGASSTANAAGSILTLTGGVYSVALTSPAAGGTFTYSLSLVPSAGTAAIVSTNAQNATLVSNVYSNVSGFGLFLYNGVLDLLNQSQLLGPTGSIICNQSVSDLSPGTFYTLAQAQNDSLINSPNQTWTINNKCSILCAPPPPKTVTIKNATLALPSPVPDASVTQWIYTLAQFRPLPSTSNPMPSQTVLFYDPGLSVQASSVSSPTPLPLTISLYNMYTSSTTDWTVGQSLNVYLIANVSGTVVYTPLMLNVSYLQCASTQFSNVPAGATTVSVGFTPSNIANPQNPTSSDFLEATSGTKIYSSFSVSLPVAPSASAKYTMNQINNVQLFLRTQGQFGTEVEHVFYSSNSALLSPVSSS